MTGSARGRPREPAGSLPYGALIESPDPTALVLATIADAHTGRIWALEEVQLNGEPLVVSAGAEGALHSWRLDGRPGPLQQPDAHTDRILALNVVEHAGEPLVVTASADGALRSWRLDGRPGPLQQPDAHTLWNPGVGGG